MNDKQSNKTDLLNGERLLTAKEAAELCHVSHPKMLEMIRMRQLKVVYLGTRSPRIEPRELRRYWDANSRVGLSNLKPDPRFTQ